VNTLKGLDDKKVQTDCTVPTGRWWKMKSLHFCNDWLLLLWYKWYCSRFTVFTTVWLSEK